VTSDVQGCNGGLGENAAFSIPADPQLVSEGWERRYLADPDRAREAIDLYESLGYEVKAQKLTPDDFGPNCGDCASVVCKSYVLIYTRKPARAG
jgi:hypothetical protein